ncbi:MAG: recombinase family protein [Mycobacterium sp.]
MTGVHCDNDLSAYNGKTRPSFEAMLNAMKHGEIDALICWHTDRLYRSMRDLERLIDIADQHRVQLRTVQGGDLVSSTSAGRMLARILGSVSRQESEHKAERQRRAARQKAEHGIPQWRRAFGYLDTPDGPVLGPQTAPLVKQAYAAIMSGCSLGDVVKTLNAAGA